MDIFPAQPRLLSASYSEEFDPSVERTEMERGVPKQRLINSQVMCQLKCVVLFDSSEDVAAFEAWYFGQIRRIGWFTVAHPRTGEALSARFEGGRLGALVPVNNNRRRWRRDVTLEYLR